MIVTRKLAATDVPPSSVGIVAVTVRDPALYDPRYGPVTFDPSSFCAKPFTTQTPPVPTPPTVIEPGT